MVRFIFHNVKKTYNTSTPFFNKMKKEVGGGALVGFPGNSWETQKDFSPPLKIKIRTQICFKSSFLHIHDKVLKSKDWKDNVGYYKNELGTEKNDCKNDVFFDTGIKQTVSVFPFQYTWNKYCTRTI